MFSFFATALAVLPIQFFGLVGADALFERSFHGRYLVVCPRRAMCRCLSPPPFGFAQGGELAEPQPPAGHSLPLVGHSPALNSLTIFLQFTTIQVSSTWMVTFARPQ